MTSTLAIADTTFGPAEHVGPLSVVELRRYCLHPGTRETLIDLFDREFVEPQEAVGMRVLGQYRDLDDPDAFVWLRGFADMPTRADALERFYGGPVWATHRDAANATMINSDNVLLLRPARGGGLSEPDGGRPAPGGERSAAGVLTSVVHSLPPGAADDFAHFFETSARPELEAAGAVIVATLVTEPGPNTFSRLPVREGETVFVWLARFGHVAAYATHVGRLAQSDCWTRHILPEIGRRTWRPAEIARLAPTARSLWR